MEKEKAKGVIEAILFSTGRNVKMAELINILELDSKTIIEIITEMQDEYAQANRGIEIVRVEDGFSLASKKDYYEYLYPALDKRIKPSLSQACLETLAIIAYNSRITRADIDAIRGVDSTSALYRLQDYNLIEQAGKADLPGRPVLYRTTEDFLKMFGLNSLKELPKLPRYKLDSNRQLVIDEMNEEVIEDEGEIDIEPTDEVEETVEEVVETPVEEVVEEKEAPIEEPEIEINESDIDIDNSNNEESNEENNNE
jgi:segregation and condensation protein B